MDDSDVIFGASEWIKLQLYANLHLANFSNSHQKNANERRNVSKEDQNREMNPKSNLKIKKF